MIPGHDDGVSSLDARLANLRVDGNLALGAETIEGVVNISATAAAMGVPAPQDVDELLQRQRAAQVRTVLDAVRQGKTKPVIIPKPEAAFAPLVTRPEKIICVGFNYREHAAETNTPIPTAPPLFNKFNNALNGHGGTVRLPTRVARQFDYETELVIIFGKECRDVTEEGALDVVAGYATGNDISARELQTATSQFLAGKTSDGFAPVGPWLVTRNRVPDPNALRLQTWVNGKVRQDWNTRDMIFNCRQLISYASSIMTIKAGDILFTGTPQGVILGEKAPREERQWLKAGDEVVSLVEGLGELRVKLI
jgi:2-keto-4-pentenoate hydratase/2-oxohepta-3-ene-1,7-dioic acid hydratase in catechol pathway